MALNRFGLSPFSCMSRRKPSISPPGWASVVTLKVALPPNPLTWVGNIIDVLGCIVVNCGAWPRICQSWTQIYLD